MSRAADDASHERLRLDKWLWAARFFKTRTLAADAIAAATAFVNGQTPEQTNTYNNGKIDVPAKPSAVIAVDKDNVKAAIVDSGYWPASDFTGLQ